MIFWSIFSLLVVIIAYWTVFWSYQRRWLFPVHRLVFDSSTKPQVAESHWLTHQWGKTELWYLKGKGDGKRLPTVMIAHGQLGVIDTWEERVIGLLNRGFNCLLVEYPGYGRSSGSPCEQTFTDTMVRAYDWLLQQPEVEPSAIIGLGRSMGGGVISLLALKRPLVCLWLMSTFTSVRPFLAKKAIPAFLVRDPLDNVKALQQHQLPCLVLHGTGDQVVPVSHARLLAAAANLADLVLETGDHDNCPMDWEVFWDVAAGFYHQIATKNNAQ